MIHGGVDGFSCLPVYLRHSDNNRSESFELFCSGSSNIWATLSDRGKENVGISLFMLNHPQCGPGCGSMLVGRSVHNQRIERLCMMVSPNSTMTCFCTLSPLTFLTHSMTSICSAYTLYLFLASSSPSTVGHCMDSSSITYS